MTRGLRRDAKVYRADFGNPEIHRGELQIAGRLHRSVNTVESHRQKIKDKLALKTASELNRAAVQWMLENG